MFGGMDVNKFRGHMKELPTVPHTDSKRKKSYHALQIMMTSLNLGEFRSLAINNAAILDPAARISHLPKAVFEAIFDEIENAVSRNGSYEFQEMGKRAHKVRFVDCEIRESLSQKTVTFGFGGLEGAKIEVPLRDLVLETPGVDEEDLLSCYLAVDHSPAAKSQDRMNTTVIGEAILRHAYVVYDLQNNVIGIAPRQFGNKSSKIVEFGKGMKSILDAESGEIRGHRLKEQKGEAGSGLHISVPGLIVSSLLVLVGGMVLFA